MSKPQPSRRLVEHRSCGNCAACCIHLSVDDPALRKAADVRCHHLGSGGGCTIYATRPQACSTFYCAWRFLGELGEDWRPDICGVLIRLNRTADGDEVFFKLIGSHDVVSRESLALVVAGMIAAGVRTFLVLQGSPGARPVSIALNPALAGAVTDRDLARVREGLREALRSAVEQLPNSGGLPPRQDPTPPIWSPGRTKTEP